ncbi:hypothetical protein Scep_017058 [Stephania cephalantha]|uniref:Uncharacterized protein n=1 Tax=Stephania cephalantha TaxID=152367 RepID=A0AAP0IPR8_9MAGN
MHLMAHEYQHHLYSNIKGFVARHALDVICKEARTVSDGVGLDKAIYGCVLRATLGLACAHEIALHSLDDSPIIFDKVHLYWKKLNMTIDPSLNGELDYLYQVQMERVEAKYKNSGPDMRAKIIQKLREITCPTSTIISAPEEKITTKGRSKNNKMHLSKRMSKSKRARVDNSTKRTPSAFEYAEAKAVQESVTRVSKRSKPSQNSQQSQPSQGT